MKPVPPDPDHCNADRAEWANLALRKFELRTCTERPNSIHELLTDLAHLCDREGYNLQDLLSAAGHYYACETSRQGQQLAYE